MLHTGRLQTLHCSADVELDVDLDVDVLFPDESIGTPRRYCGTIYVYACMYVCMCGKNVPDKKEKIAIIIPTQAGIIITIP